MTTLFAMTVDTEEEWDWEAGWPTGTPSVENVRQLPRFQALCSRHGVATTYFANWAVIDNPESRRTLLDLAGHEGVEIGMHLHPWSTPPFDGRGPVRSRETFLHNLEPGLIRGKLERVYDGFRHLGLTPTSFRGGRYSSGAVCQEFLRDAGFLADASVVPYTTWREDGAPDYRERGPEPVRLPPRHEGDRAFWEIPVTSGFTRRPARLWNRLFRAAEGAWLRKLRLVGIADRLNLVRRYRLGLDAPDEKVFSTLRLLERCRPPFICFVIHSSTLIPGGNPYTRTASDAERLFALLERLCGALARCAGFRPATVSEIALALERAAAGAPTAAAAAAPAGR